MSNDAAIETPAESIVSIELDALPSDVWDALTTDHGLEQWMGDGATAGSEQGDEIFVPDPVTGKPRRGVLDEVSPHHRLGYTWWPETDPERSTRVAITLTPCETGTRVTVVESLPPSTIVGLSVTSSALASPVGQSPWRARQRLSLTAQWSWRMAMLTLAIPQYGIERATSCDELTGAHHG